MGDGAYRCGLGFCRCAIFEEYARVVATQLLKPPDASKIRVEFEEVGAKNLSRQLRQEHEFKPALAATDTAHARSNPARFSHPGHERLREIG
jgi:hypothetical protein